MKVLIISMLYGHLDCLFTLLKFFFSYSPVSSILRKSMLIILFLLAILLNTFTKSPPKLHLGHLILAFLLHFSPSSRVLNRKNSLKNNFFR